MDQNDLEVRILEMLKYTFSGLFLFSVVKSCFASKFFAVVRIFMKFSSFVFFMTGYW